MSAEWVNIQEALVYIFGPLIINVAIPLLLALGVLAAILSGITVLLSKRPGPQGKGF
jgi:hypothetical protein